MTICAAFIQLFAVPSALGAERVDVTVVVPAEARDEPGAPPARDSAPPRTDRPAQEVPSAEPDPTTPLPRTGADAQRLAALACALMAAGWGVLITTRRPATTDRRGPT